MIVGLAQNLTVLVSPVYLPASTLIISKEWFLPRNTL